MSVKKGQGFGHAVTLAILNNVDLKVQIMSNLPTQQPVLIGQDFNLTNGVNSLKTAYNLYSSL